jgi:alpha,alpha-trehalose phosphorylase
MIKQADVIMAHFLLPEDTPIERRKADFDFYDPLTTGDSSLSPAIQSAVASRLGLRGPAWNYFRHAAAIDLGNLVGNTADGIHLAAAAGVWLAVVKGFAGFELGTDGVVRTDPQLPASWRSLTIRMRLRGEPVEISLGGN